jgi:hypothetical protein
MVLLEIDPAGFAVFEFEGDAPRSIDVDRIALRIEPLQGMKVEAWNIHFLGSDGDVKTIKSCENAFMHFRIDLGTLALGPKLREGFAFEGPDHKSM